MLVNLSTHSSKCNMMLFAKQFDTRVSTFSGFFDLVLTYGWAMLDGYAFTVDNDLFTELTTINFNTDSCSDLGTSMGVIWSKSLTAYASEDYFVADVQYSVS